MEKKELVKVKNLKVVFESRFDRREILRGVDFSLTTNETVGLVGINGSGKSTFAMALMGLLPKNAKIVSGSISIDGMDMLVKSVQRGPYGRKSDDTLINKGIERLRGRFITMVTQEVASYLDPLLDVGYQIFEPVLFHDKNRLIKRIESRDALNNDTLSKYVKLLTAKDYSGADKFLEENFDMYVKEQILSIIRRDDLTDEDKKNLILALGKTKTSAFQKFIISNRHFTSKVPGFRRVFNKLLYDEGYKLASEILGLMGLDTSILRMFPNQLSGGMLQAVMVASAIINNPKVIIMDEPASSLDPIAQYRLFNLLDKIKKNFDLSLILIAHDITLLSKFADRIVVIEDGAVVEAGDASDIINNPSNEYTKNLIRSVIKI
ncbi:MAG: ATP-binding cassette domain-containing protein [Candidatus Acidifodinimicrobium sp.]